jgi:hypothetical protein
LPKLGQVPTGNWTGIKWIAIPGGHAPAVTGDQATVVGSGQGYSEFIWDPSRRTLTPWFSADGLTWKAGAKLDTSAWASYLKDWDGAGAASDPQWHDDCGFGATDFAEGPQAMLLRGYVECGATCGGAGSAAATWVSPDGLSWTPATIPEVVSGAISGGSSGFVALSTANSTTELWTSQDGRAWTKGSLPPEAVAPGAWANTPVSIAGGFVLAGVVTVKKGHESGDGGGCGAGVDLTEHQAALWWSPDGTTWTRDSLSRATPTYLGISMDAHRIDDHTVVAIETLYSNTDTGSTTTIEWVSSDGKSWTVLNGNPVDETSAWEGPGSPCPYAGCIVEGWDRGLIYAWNSDQSAATVSAFNDRLALVTLKQTGALPWWDQNVGLVMGPSGILASDGGTRFWIGVPTVG